MFRALAQADESVVPAVRFRRVRGERLMEDEKGEMATGKSVYALAVVRTIKKVRRGFERESSAVVLWRRDLDGSLDEREESWDEASGGIVWGPSRSLLDLCLFLRRLAYEGSRWPRGRPFSGSPVGESSSEGTRGSVVSSTIGSGLDLGICWGE